MPINIFKKKNKPSLQKIKLEEGMSNVELKRVLDNRVKIVDDLLSSTSAISEEDKVEIRQWKAAYMQKPWAQYNPSELSDNYKEMIRQCDRFGFKNTILDKLNLELASLAKQYELMPNTKDGTYQFSDKIKKPSTRQKNALFKANSILAVIHVLNQFKNAAYTPESAQGLYDALVKLRDLSPSSNRGFIRRRGGEIDKALELAREALPVQPEKKVSKITKVKRALHL